MNQIFETDSLSDSVNDEGVLEDFDSLAHPSYQSNSSAKSLTYMRQIEILRENKLLMSSLKDIYDS